MIGNKNELFFCSIQESGITNNIYWRVCSFQSLNNWANENGNGDDAKAGVVVDVVILIAVVLADVNIIAIVSLFPSFQKKIEWWKTKNSVLLLNQNNLKITNLPSLLILILFFLIKIKFGEKTIIATVTTLNRKKGIFFY